MYLNAKSFLSEVEEWVYHGAARMGMMWPLKGGWEAWAQAEICAYIFAKDSRYNILREQPVYQNAYQRADFLINNHHSLEHQVIVELKCQSLENYESFGYGLEQDRAKLANLRSEYSRSAKIVLGLYFTETALPAGFRTNIINEIGVCRYILVGI